MLFRKNEVFQKYSFLSALEKGGRGGGDVKCH